MNYEDLMFDTKGGIATITLNAPESRNALTKKMKKSLFTVVREIATNDEIRAVIVTGAGPVFSAGGDLKMMKTRMDGTLEESRYERLQRIGYWADLFPRLEKPVIAAINGAAVGGGFSMVLSCDIRIAADDAKFGSVFILRGLVPDSGMTYYLPRAVGVSRALELMWTGDIIGAEEARSLGIVSRVVPRNELMKAANDLAARLVRQPPVAVELAKRLVYGSIVDDIARHIDWESYGQQMCWRTEDFRESTMAFLEKRTPRPFKGK